MAKSAASRVHRDRGRGGGGQADGMPRASVSPMGYEWNEASSLRLRPQTAGAVRPWAATHGDMEMARTLGRARTSLDAGLDAHTPRAARVARRDLGSAATRQRCQSARLAQRPRVGAAAPRASPGPNWPGDHPRPTPPQQRQARPAAQSIRYGDMRNASPTRVTAASLYDAIRVAEDPSKFEGWTLALQEWEESFAAEEGNYDSVLLYCQMKLKEAFAGQLGEATNQPDPFHVAVVCKLHEKLLRLFGRYEGVMSVLHDEMVRAIYPRPEDPQQPKGAEPHARGWGAAKRAVDCPPYFAQAARVARQNMQLKARIEILAHKEDFIEREKTQRQFAIRFTVNTWRWKCCHHMWDKWKLLTELGRTVLNTARARFAQRRLMRRFNAWKQWQLTRHVQRYREFVAIIKPEHSVHDFPIEEDDLLDLDNFGRPKKRLTIIERIAWFREQDCGYQELLSEKQEVEKELQKIQSNTVDFAQELFETKTLHDQHLNGVQREKLFTRWSLLSSKARIGTEHKQLGKRLREIRAASNRAAEEARERSEKLGAMAAKTYGRRMVRTFRTAEETKRDNAAKHMQRIMRGWMARKRYSTEIADHRKMLLSAKTLGLVGPRSSRQQHLLFKLDYLDKELARLEQGMQQCPDACCLGDLRAQDPVDILLAWVNHHLECAGSKRRLQEWTVDLYDSEIFAVLIDQLSKPEVVGAVTKPSSLLDDAESSAGEKAVKGTPSMRARVMGKAGPAERATLVARQLAQWQDHNGVRGVVGLLGPHVASPDGPIGDKPKLQFAVARMFALRAGLPAAGRTAKWFGRYEHLQLNLSTLQSQVKGSRAQRRGWCSVRTDAAAST